MNLFKYTLSILLIFGMCQTQASDETAHSSNPFLTHVLLESKRENNIHHFYYRLHLTNIDQLRNREFTLFSINCLGEVNGKAQLSIDSEGLVWIKESEKAVPLSEYEFTLANILQGECVDFIVVDNESQILTGTRVFPKPLECRDADGARLRLQLCSQNGNYTLEGYGFKPGEALVLISQSEDEESMPLSFNAGVEGSISVGVCPQICGKPYGHGHITLKRQNGSELLLSYLWGITEEKLAVLSPTGWPDRNL